METEKVIYLVTEYASRGEIFGNATQQKPLNLAWFRSISNDHVLF